MLEANQKSQLYTKLRSVLSLFCDNVSLLSNGVAAEISLCQKNKEIISDSFEKPSNTFFPGQGQLDIARLELRALLHCNEQFLEKIFGRVQLGTDVLKEAKEFVDEQLPKLMAVLNIVVVPPAFLGNAPLKDRADSQTVSTRTPSPPK